MMAQEFVLIAKIKYYDAISVGSNRCNAQNKWQI